MAAWGCCGGEAVQGRQTGGLDEANFRNVRSALCLVDQMKLDDRYNG